MPTSDLSPLIEKYPLPWERRDMFPDRCAAIYAANDAQVLEADGPMLYEDDRALFDWIVATVNAGAPASQGRVDPLTDDQRIIASDVIELGKDAAHRFKIVERMESGGDAYAAVSIRPDHRAWVRADEVGPILEALCASQSPSPWLPLHVEAVATVGDRILVFLPKTHETLIAEYEDVGEDLGGLWMVEGGAIDRLDNAQWMPIPVPGKAQGASQSPSPSSWNYDMEQAPRRHKIVVAYKNASDKWRRVVAMFYEEGELESSEGDDWAEEGWYECCETHCEELRPVEGTPECWTELPPLPYSEVKGQANG